MIFKSLWDFTMKSIATYAETINDASRLCFGAAISCFVVGTMGWIANYFVEGTTMLHGLLVVAVFYFLLGVVNLFEKQSNVSKTLEQKCNFVDDSYPRDGDLTPYEQIEPAA